MNLLIKNLKRYLDDDGFKKEVEGANIQLLDCERELDMKMNCMETFWNKFYGPHVPKVVICGINPGRFGAGLTGIPFLDYRSLSEIGFNMDKKDSEQSSEFFFEVFKKIGTERFFKSFYVTNFSSVGYSKNGRNINYYDLPDKAKKTVYANFSTEMKSVNPTHIISLGVSVQYSVRELVKSEAIAKDVDHSLRLAHPSWVMTYRRKNKDMWVDKYVNELERILGLAGQEAT